MDENKGARSFNSFPSTTPSLVQTYYLRKSPSQSTSFSLYHGKENLSPEEWHIQKSNVKPALQIPILMAPLTKVHLLPKKTHLLRVLPSGRRKLYLDVQDSEASSLQEINLEGQTWFVKDPALECRVYQKFSYVLISPWLKVMNCN